MIVWHIGDVVRKMREAYVDKETGRCGLSQRELADRAGIRPNTLSDIERNTSNFGRETLVKIAVALDITIDGLYGQLPGASLPVTTDPVDAETIARFLKLKRDQRATVRVVVDQLGLFPDRTTQDQHDGQDAESASRSGT